MESVCAALGSSRPCAAMGRARPQSIQPALFRVVEARRCRIFSTAAATASPTEGPPSRRAWRPPRRSSTRRPRSRPRTRRRGTCGSRPGSARASRRTARAAAQVHLALLVHVRVRRVLRRVAPQLHEVAHREEPRPHALLALLHVDLRDREERHDRLVEARDRGLGGRGRVAFASASLTFAAGAAPRLAASTCAPCTSRGSATKRTRTLSGRFIAGSATPSGVAARAGKFEPAVGAPERERRGPSSAAACSPRRRPPPPPRPRAARASPWRGR